MILSIADKGAIPPAVTFTVDQVVSPYMGVFFAAFFVAVISTPIMALIANRLGIVDKPDGLRKLHGKTTAYLGGLALLLAWLAGVGVSRFVHPHGEAGDTVEMVGIPLAIVLGAVTVTLVGLWDDVFSMRARYKLMGQLAAAGFLIVQGIGPRIVAGCVGSLSTALGTDLRASVPPIVIEAAGNMLVIFFVLGGCNATNLLDGLDGLAGGVIAVVALALTFIAVALAIGVYPGGGAYSPAVDPVRIVLSLALLGAVLGFLPYNFKPAIIFMGDAGSMLLGFLAVSMIMMLGEKGDPLLVMAGLTIFAMPILDTALTIARRIARGLPLSTPDAHHLHHLLVKSGLGVRRAVCVLYLIAIGFSVLGCAMLFTRLRFVAAIFSVVFTFIAIIAFKLGQQHYRTEQVIKATSQSEAQSPTLSRATADGPRVVGVVQAMEPVLAGTK
jgi:UDP-GlcNAc:undecaprenyl-phosphate GlcNAc-1-phosphate transferase